MWLTNVDNGGKFQWGNLKLRENEEKEEYEGDKGKWMR